MRNGGKVDVTDRYKRGVVGADSIYKLNGVEKNEEWFRISFEAQLGAEVSAQLPDGAKHDVPQLNNDNQFRGCHPKIEGANQGSTEVCGLGGRRGAIHSIRGGLL